MFTCEQLDCGREGRDLLYRVYILVEDITATQSDTAATGVTDQLESVIIGVLAY